MMGHGSQADIIGREAVAMPRWIKFLASGPAVDYIEQLENASLVRLMWTTGI
jgi:hypothetical protein